jgi:glucose/arabinose dehydrogenase
MIRFPFASAAAICVSSAACAQPAGVEPPPNVPEFRPAFEGQTRAPRVASGLELAAETLAAPLEHPWAIALTPDGAILVTERPGRLRAIRDGVLAPEPVAGLPEVVAEKQGGLLDVTVGPDFAADRRIYWT